MKKKKKIAKVKQKIKMLKDENARLHQRMKEFAEQVEQAERILHEAWVDAGEEDERLEKAGRMLYTAYMPVKSPLDDFWMLTAHYDHADPCTDFLKRACTYSPESPKKKKRAAYAFEVYTGWETAKDMPLNEIECRLREEPTWDLGLMREICRRAHMLREWQKADCLSFERVAGIAAKRLGVDIGIPDNLARETEKDKNEDSLTQSEGI